LSNSARDGIVGFLSILTTSLQTIPKQRMSQDYSNGDFSRANAPKTWDSILAERTNHIQLVAITLIGPSEMHWQAKLPRRDHN